MMQPPSSGGGGSGIYYVDPVAGSDSNNGTSTATPWKTAAKVNNGASYAGGGLSPGQSVLFKGGNTLVGSLTFKAGVNVASFSATNPIGIGSYGGSDAIINSSQTGANTWGMMLDGMSGIVVAGLTISSNNTQCQTGICIQNTVTSAGTSNISVIDCTVGGFYGTGSNIANSANIYIAGAGHPLNGTGLGTISNINILNSVINGLSGVTSPDSNGILANGSITGSGYGVATANLSGITVAGCTIFNIGGSAGTSSAGSGIQLAQTQNSTIKYCLAHDIGANVTTFGSCGMWFFASINGTIEYCESYNVRPWPNSAFGDFEGFNLDGGSQNCTISHCYSHDNFGPGLLGYVSSEGTGAWNNNTYCYNIVVNCAYGSADGQFGAININGGNPGDGFQPSGTCSVFVYNNTVINLVAGQTFGSGGTLSNITSAPIPSCYTAVDNAWVPTSGYVANNIFYQTANSGTTKFVYVLTSMTAQFINNAYYSPTSGSAFQCALLGTGQVDYASLAAWQAVIPGGEVGAITTNPLFNSSGTTGDASWTPSAQVGPNAVCPTAYKLTSAS